jgi:putative ABC transport system permease protein
MNSLRTLFSRVRSLFSRRKSDDEFAQELDSHLALLADEFIRRGIAPDEARRLARLRLGGAAQLHETNRDLRGLPFLESFAQDVRFALRMLRKSPAFTAVAILTLALGIGANTAIFSLLDAVLLRTLPVEHPEQLQILARNYNGEPNSSMNNPLWEAIRDNQSVFSGMLAWGTRRFDLTNGGEAHFAQGLYVSGGYFQTLGVKPALGRLFQPSDDCRGCAATAVLSYSFWQSHFGGDPGVLGRDLSLDSHPFSIIGVAAPGFSGVDVGEGFDVAIPISSEAIVNTGMSCLDHRSCWWLSVMGRLDPGVTPQQASASLAVLSPVVLDATVPQHWTADMQQNYRKRTLMLVPAAKGSAGLRRQYETPLQVLMGIVALVLLIACANIAGLMLARSAARRKEIALRLALGASRRRVIRQLLTECVLLSVAGAALGLLFARWGTDLMVSRISSARSQVFLDLAPDSRILAFTAAVSIFTGLLFGMLPALRATRVSLISAMKGAFEESRAGRYTFRTGRAVVAFQVALSLALLVGAGLFLRSFLKLTTIPSGFDRSNVLLVTADMQNAHFTSKQEEAAREEILKSLRALPGVESAGNSLTTPIGGATWDNVIFLHGKSSPQPDDVYFNAISPGFFDTLHMHLLNGRDITEQDLAGSALVSVVNQTFARRFFPGENPVGQYFHQEGDPGKPGPPILIVGLVADAKYDSLQEEFSPTAFFPSSQAQISGSSYLVRTHSNPLALERPVEAVFVAVNDRIALRFTTLERQVEDSISRERLLATLSGFFGALALLLAMIGLYGMLSYIVSQRRQEIGIRMALGAGASSILRLVLGEVAALLAIGVGAGLAIAALAGRVVEKLLFNLHARDAWTMALSAAALIAVSLVAAWLPARRASRVDPVSALRCE